MPVHTRVIAHLFMRYCGTAFQSGNPSGMRILVTVGRRRAYVTARKETEINS